jgi:hypothetical protein
MIGFWDFKLSGAPPLLSLALGSGRNDPASGKIIPDLKRRKRYLTLLPRKQS